MSVRLDVLDLRDLLFPASFAWIDEVEFNVAGKADDLDLLTALIAHPRYDHGYMSPWSEDLQGIHGRYLLTAISPASFRAREVEETREHLTTWAGAVDPETAASSEFERFLDRVLPARSFVYELPPAPRAAEHEAAFVIGQATGFHEFVVISPDRSRLTLVVASDD